MLILKATFTEWKHLTAAATHWMLNCLHVARLLFFYTHTHICRSVLTHINTAFHFYFNLSVIIRKYAYYMNFFLIQFSSQYKKVWVFLFFYKFGRGNVQPFLLLSVLQNPECGIYAHVCLLTLRVCLFIHLFIF